MGKILSYLSQILVLLVQGLIRVYQATLSPDHGLVQKPYGHCRFYPTCSLYAHEALGRFGLVRGFWLAGKRVLRCNPFHAPEVDLVPEHH
ncbi:membrane protein insertion efficiency factor YidD [Candidatus Uhrbacteria bacterium RIFCSPHIGHO2_12_FULL_54_23]|uniref:Putative membrane protein insertion efficiency factor n=3 Tax=Candidatus Uhriibacteriota TaxID=1752732 RepID=A0A1F7UFI2_9BACT|nr:MAG: membrane protein insertion efficiency factor YidD [Candidatus Uhrbacteria bacterium RIFCSPHIGHO2_12_FULL_54_23]OGL85279.1 MAG: membrane protein insertion efficiency factor YidD [Candidatus Uhrbacteria bacterium RIFCSPLOWO2_01_FULL_55_36]OGL89534.1 MAG: membrane protein insertion efficiency factor YidD [Candidatus Uhrbacteria bacterium RIFCSPLOWO2_02_FULL_54_37]